MYPRIARPPAVPRPLEGDADLARLLHAFDTKAALDERVCALWAVAGLDAWRRLDDAALTGKTLAEALGSLLDDDDLVLASEAVEALFALAVPGGDAARDLAVSVDKRGRLGVFGKSLEQVAASTKPPDVVRVVPLVKLAALAPLTQAPVLAWPRTVPGHDLVVERGPHQKLPAAVLRMRGDEALVGSLRDAALSLPVPRRQLRLRRAGDGFTIADVYAEGFSSLNGKTLTGAVPVKDGARVDVAGEGRIPGVTLTLRFVPRLDRKSGVTVRFVDQGRRVERLAVGEALYFGPDPGDDVASAVRGHLVATPAGPVLASAAPMPQVRLEGADVVVRDI